MRWITADLHFSHSNILKFCPNSRGKFTDVDHMTESMINEWNATVQPEDEVFILGDVAFSNGNKAADILRRLNGSKILVEGNHDAKNLKVPAFRACFKEVHPYLHMRHNKADVVMFHFPILEWANMHYGSVHFFGHVHGKATGLEKFRARDVGFDATGRVVSALDDMIKDALTGEIKTHHG